GQRAQHCSATHTPALSPLPLHDALPICAVLPRAAERAVVADLAVGKGADEQVTAAHVGERALGIERAAREPADRVLRQIGRIARSEEHTSELQSQSNLVCRLLLEKKKTA